ncbi:hypothetical protein ABRQ03_12400 [Pectobacterium jejuense]
MSNNIKVAGVTLPDTLQTEDNPHRTRVPTVLTDRSFTQFDALFHWED